MIWFKKKKKTDGLSSQRRNKVIIITQDVFNQGLGSFPYECIVAEVNEGEYSLPQVAGIRGMRNFCINMWGVENMAFDTRTLKSGEEVFFMMVPAACFNSLAINGLWYFIHMDDIHELQKEDLKALKEVRKTLDI